jgi:diaminohydroxyphosphoribosylaminopyrimidine deaminase / 5-amino-6-(5-phosphoribosylamino)uracil reductase
VLSGIGTVLEDDPRLDVREVPTPRQPTRVVVDSQLQTPPIARLFEVPGPVWIYAAQDDAARRAALQARGAHIRCLPNAQGKVDLHALLQDLGTRGINELHVEAGHKLNASLLQAGLVDELLIYLAPKMLGPGREMAALGPLTQLADALAFEFTQVQLVGEDLRLLARPRQRALR